MTVVIHGPKGVGFLYINEKVRVQPQILGGGQQNGMRSGTDNVPVIAGLGVAAELLPALPVSQLPDDPKEGWSPHNPGLSDRQKAEPLPHATLPL